MYFLEGTVEKVIFFNHNFIEIILQKYFNARNRKSAKFYIEIYQNTW